MIFSPLWNNTFFTFIHQNHTIERRWPEINNRVNYPLKEALVQLVDQELIDMDCSLTRYCVSNLSCQLCHLGISRVVEAWNNHMISGMLNNVQNITLDKHLTFITNLLRLTFPKCYRKRNPQPAWTGWLYKKNLSNTTTPWNWSSWSVHGYTGNFFDKDRTLSQVNMRSLCGQT